MLCGDGCALLHTLKWDDLQFILAVSRGGTLSAAASSLGVAHTTVSRRLQLCEEHLGVRLFDRTPEGFHATPAGEDLTELAERVEGEVLSAEGRVMGRDVELRGSLRFSTLDFLFVASQPAFRSFITRYPNIDVTVTTPMDPVSLNRREADVALRLTESPPPGLVGRRMGKLQFAVYASHELVARVGAEKGYSAYPWLGMDTRLEFSRWLDEWLATNAPGAQVVARIDENSMVTRSMISAGFGAFFLPILEGDAMGLHRVGPILSEHTTSVWLLTLPALRATSRVQAFMEHMGAELPILLEPAPV